jgi:hypothetical protein
MYMTNNIIRKISVIAMALGVLLFYSGSLMAYIDPGTGSYIFQVIVTVAAGAIFGIKVFWKNIVKFFSDKFGKTKNR